ncbi:signal recognition particle, SRP9/SRP14 subunit [Phellopilus nigrolimitatus]|nr:signal recognition particle, SRP9/SRP14 subunit [Phellopilus nigrolimitatus]
MVYVHSWTEYQAAAEALYAGAPGKARYCVKWKAGEGKLVLKITDDTTCLKYKTHSSVFLNRFEALNAALLAKMQNRAGRGRGERQAGSPVPVSVPGEGSGGGGEGGSRAGTPGPGPAPVSGGGVQGGGVKKKKGKKKK